MKLQKYHNLSKDKKKIKTTVFITGFLTTFFLVFSIIFGVFTPHVKEFKDYDGEPFSYLVQGDNGKSYFTGNNDFLVERNSETDSRSESVV